MCGKKISPGTQAYTIFMPWRTIKNLETGDYGIYPGGKT